MGIFDFLKAQKAHKLHAQGQLEEARAMYAEAYKTGAMDVRYQLSYAVLLIRLGDYATARELLIKAQKAPALTAEQKTQLFMNYAACVYKMGEIDKGIALLERQHAKSPAGTIYETLGYLYVEKLMDRPDPNEPAPVPEQSDDAAAEGEETSADVAAQPEAPVLTPYEKWEQLRDKAAAYLQAAIEYDDEDAICLDNQAQFLYRVMGDKDAARPWFEKAHKLKPKQIDTLWFLSRYDLDNGDTAAAVEKLEAMLDGRFSPLNYITKAQVEEELKRLGK